MLRQREGERSRVPSPVRNLPGVRDDSPEPLRPHGQRRPHQPLRHTSKVPPHGGTFDVLQGADHTDQIIDREIRVLGKDEERLQLRLRELPLHVTPEPERARRRRHHPR